MEESIPMPGGAIAKRKLNFFWICDCSGSMGGAKIEVLNRAIREVIPTIVSALETHPEVQMMMRAIRFSDEATWHVGPDAVPIEKFLANWSDLTTDSRTGTAKAFRLLASELDIEKMPRRGLPPVCILISDGYCTDDAEEYDRAIAALIAMPWGKKAVRLAIGIGNDVSNDELLKFISHRDVGVLHAQNADQLVKWITWASVTASIAVSKGKSRGDHAGQDGVAVQIAPPPPMAPELASAADVF